MGCRAHIQIKREIEYADDTYFNFNWAADGILDFLRDNGVIIFIVEYDLAKYWKVNKESLRKIPDYAYGNTNKYLPFDFDADNLHNFVKDMLAAETGDWAYVDWG